MLVRMQIRRVRVLCLLKELAIHLRERAPETLVQIARIADQYLEAQGKRLFSSPSKTATSTAQGGQNEESAE